MEESFSLDKILTYLTMIIYPRSLAGLNLNPIKEEQDFQSNDVETLLRRMRFTTYLNESGWRIISTIGNFNYQEGYQKEEKEIFKIFF